MKEHRTAKLNWDQVDEIRDMLDDGVPVDKIALIFSTSHSNISRIKHKESWFDLKRELARRQRRDAKKSNPYSL